MTHATEILAENQCVAIRDGQIIFVGPMESVSEFQANCFIDCDHRLVTPGLIDCHTHLIYAGDRASEHALKLKGHSYGDIAKSGGGILSTVRATRAMDEDGLIKEALLRLDAMIIEGVCTVEIKSGYGLSLDAEIKLLRVAKALESLRPIRVTKTLLAAHALPSEFADKDDYIDHICDVIIPEVARLNLADSVDGFCETIAFSQAQIKRVFVAAKTHGFKLKLHAEQLSACGGASMAAHMDALSCDHLEYATKTDLMAMKAHDTVAVLLPGAYYFLKETKAPPIGLMREMGLKMAVATDCNPGTSPLTSPLVAMNMAMVLFGLTPYEALMGMTKAAAFALGKGDQIGQINQGFVADLLIWNCETPSQLLCQIGQTKLHKRLWEGAVT